MWYVWLLIRKSLREKKQVKELNKELKTGKRTKQRVKMTNRVSVSLTPLLAHSLGSTKKCLSGCLTECTQEEAEKLEWQRGRGFKKCISRSSGTINQGKEKCLGRLFKILDNKRKKRRIKSAK